ncbi:MAG: hypothetical protein HZC41_18540 [Chloroflexi bacterium]|nr:hypothetical protein [Chloroflexota bacterium]
MTSLHSLLIEAAARHLPPSGAALRLLDVGGKAGTVLAALRDDLEILPVGKPGGWSVSADTADAVVAYDVPPDVALLRTALDALRPGGRLIVISPTGEPRDLYVRLLEGAGYTRILVENAIECPSPVGVLMRGEKPHTEERTVDRVRQVAARDEMPRPGRYVYILVNQLPNKPAWMLQPDERLEWGAVAVSGDDETVLLAFSSLPKAVAFMQPAVLNKRIEGVNKIAKYRWDVVHGWPNPVMLNPTDDILETNAVVLLPVDPASAEIPDE